ncbi:hypothetical protein INR49_003786 [Caranx melampygus]|nr:hypothetical protein INR49_003786 [Caranx melampygus]
MGKDDEGKMEKETDTSVYLCQMELFCCFIREVTHHHGTITGRNADGKCEILSYEHTEVRLDQYDEAFAVPLEKPVQLSCPSGPAFNNPSRAESVKLANLLPRKPAGAAVGLETN